MSGGFAAVPELHPRAGRAPRTASSTSSSTTKGKRWGGCGGCHALAGRAFPPFSSGLAEVRSQCHRGWPVVPSASGKAAKLPKPRCLRGRPCFTQHGRLKLPGVAGERRERTASPRAAPLSLRGLPAPSLSRGSAELPRPPCAAGGRREAGGAAERRQRCPASSPGAQAPPPPPFPGVRRGCGAGSPVRLSQGRPPPGSAMALETLSPDWEFDRLDDGSQSERPRRAGRAGPGRVGGVRREAPRSWGRRGLSRPCSPPDRPAASPPAAEGRKGEGRKGEGSSRGS